MTPLRWIRPLAATLAAAAVLSTGAHAGDLGSPRSAPPPLVDDGVSVPPDLSGAKVLGTIEYSHGDPTDEEQLFMELMNRARLDPQGEADRILVDYDNVDVAGAVDFFLGQDAREFTRQENHDAFDSYPAQPPFAFNAQISDAARGWSQVLKDQNMQVHELPGRPRLRERLENEGYFGSFLAESIFSYAKGMVHAHAGFAVDWGQAIDPQTNRPRTGHRESLMNYQDLATRDYREAGVGVLSAPAGGGNVGPRIITIDFSIPTDADARFVTGVCYDDTNRNGLYDIGEGVEGVRIDVSSSTFFAITSASGGYAVPVDKDDGNVEVTTTPTATPGSEIIGTQRADVSTLDNDPGGGNVKVDFVVPPDPPAPDFATVLGNTPALVDGGQVDATALVGALDPGSDTVGDIDVTLSITHANRAELQVTLVSPGGKQLLLFDGGSPGADLKGTFNTTLKPSASLAGMVGEAYEGTWRLRIADAAGGSVGTLDSWSLSIRPAWIRGLFSPQTNLFVTKLKLKDVATPGKDAIILKAEVDVGALLPDTADDTVMLTLLDLGQDRAEIFHVDVTPVVAPKAATLDGGRVKTRVTLNRKDTSKALLTVKVKNIDLPPIPANVGMELYVGDVLVGQDFTLTALKYVGKKTAPLDLLFRVEKVKSTGSAAARTTVVRGRFHAVPALQGLGARVTFSVGDFSDTRTASEFTVVGTKHTFKGVGALRKLVIDLGRGVFVAKVVGPHEAKVGASVPVSLRVGGVFVSTHVVPRDTGTKIRY